MVGKLPNGVGRPLLLVALVLVPLIVGCGRSGYPDDLTYPARLDPLVPPKATFPEETDTLDSPGKLDEHIRSLKTMPGATVDLLEPSDIHPDFRAAIRTVLTVSFGTPAKPRVDLPADHPARDQAPEANKPSFRDASDVLRLDESTLAEGSKLYRRHCLHCHGLAGDGRGASGAWLNPHPRDYRQGLFKFVSVLAQGDYIKPTREDLYRTIQRGIEGTSMPSFITLSHDELHALVSYVIHLSIRGDVEYRALLMARARQNAVPPDKVKDEAKKLGNYLLYGDPYKQDFQQGMVYGLVVDLWAEAPKKVQEPKEWRLLEGKELEDSIRRGYNLMADKDKAAKINCLQCHTDFGRQARLRYDKWGTLVRPNNWTAGIYRGGRRPMDTYWRIRNGIDPSGMPPFDLPEKDIWDLVRFVQALPYPHMLPDDVRLKVYGEGKKKE
jgi:mono/diheme cytochrome c family protein